MAASDRFAISVNGTGGHGAMPHLAADPVVAGAAIVSALQPLVSRETSPTDGAVVTVARINTGTDVSECPAVCKKALQGCAARQFNCARHRCHHGAAVS